MTNVKTYSLNSESSKQVDHLHLEAVLAPGQEDLLKRNIKQAIGLNARASSLTKIQLEAAVGHTYHIVIKKARLTRTTRIPPSKNGGLIGDRRSHDLKLVMSRQSWVTLIAYLVESTPSADARLTAFILRYGYYPVSYVKTLNGKAIPDFYIFCEELRNWIIVGAINNRGSATSVHFNDNIKVYVNIATNSIVYLELR